MSFFTSLTSFPSVQKSCLRFRCDQGSQICCQSLIEFDRLRQICRFRDHFSFSLPEPQKHQDDLKRTKNRNVSFFTSLTSFPSVQKSCLRFRCDQGSQICCQSLIEFDRLRPFPVIHRLSSIFFVALEFVTVRSSSTEFDRFVVFVIISRFHFLNRKSTRMISKGRKIGTCLSSLR